MNKKYIMLIFIFFFVNDWIYGYLDPGSGSYLIQILIAAFVGVSFGIKVFWKKIKSFFIRSSSKKKEE